MNIPFRPLGKVRDIVQATGLDISYAYDDLVFSDHSVFILRFDNENPDMLYIYFNTKCNDQSDLLKNKLKFAAEIAGFNIIYSGLFTIKQLNQEEEVEINFLG